MSLWRLEWLRLVRTRRWVGPTAIYLLFGLLGPLTARYLGELLASVGGIEVVLPDPTPADGFAQYVANVSQLGILAVVVVAASSLSIDRPVEMGVFLRTRVRRTADLVIPRVVTMSALAVGAWVLGALAAWYEVTILLGPADAAAVLAGTAYGAVHLVFVVTLVAALSARGGSTMTTTLSAVAVLLSLPLLALVPAVERWVPSELVGALDAMVAGASLTRPLPAAGVALALSALSIAFAIRRLGVTEP